jgi:dGTPase
MIKLLGNLAEEIENNNQLREEAQYSKHACLSSQAIRLKKEKDDPLRPSFFHATDRILHSPIYTRYIDKTQVFSHIQNDHITHRVLHVQLVAKIARVIGRTLNLNEDLIEAIALGHDLGHVPYGHEGEYILNKICQEEDLGYFVHNAQSVRAVMEIEKAGLPSSKE